MPKDVQVAVSDGIASNTTTNMLPSPAPANKQQQQQNHKSTTTKSAVTAIVVEATAIATPTASVTSINTSTDYSTSTTTTNSSNGSSFTTTTISVTADTNGTSTPPVPLKHRIPLEILDDVASRFIINLPFEERNNLIRICFQIELAHWFYLDFYNSDSSTIAPTAATANLSGFIYNDDNDNIVNGTTISTTNRNVCGMYQFTVALFQHIPFLRVNLPKVDEILQNWKKYKTTVPTFGAILMTQDLQHVLLVQSFWAKSSWGFPKGKVNESEPPDHCAVREVYEETGYDITRLLNKSEYTESVINFQFVRLYFVRGVPFQTKFAPRTRKEIKSCEWFPIDKLPVNKNDNISRTSLGISSNAFFMIFPFVKRLKKWVAAQRNKDASSVANINCNGQSASTSLTTTTVASTAHSMALMHLDDITGTQQLQMLLQQSNVVQPILQPMLGNYLYRPIMRPPLYMNSKAPAPVLVRPDAQMMSARYETPALRSAFTSDVKCNTSTVISDDGVTIFKPRAILKTMNVTPVTSTATTVQSNHKVTSPGASQILSKARVHQPPKTLLDNHKTMLGVQPADQPHGTALALVKNSLPPKGLMANGNKHVHQKVALPTRKGRLGGVLAIAKLQANSELNVLDENSPPTSNELTKPTKAANDIATERTTRNGITAVLDLVVKTTGILDIDTASANRPDNFQFNVDTILEACDWDVADRQ